MLSMWPQQLVCWNSLGVTLSTMVHAPKLQQRDATLQYRDMFKEVPLGCLHCCGMRGDPVVVKRGVTPTIKEAELMG